MGSSNIDITLATANIGSKVRNWSVSNDTDSDHNTISFDLHINMRITNEDLYQAFDTRKADWYKFQNALARHELTNNGDVHTQAESLTNAIRSAALESIPLKKRKKNMVTLPPWWTTDLTNSKRALNLARRNNSLNYATVRNNHLKLIKSAKMSAWRLYSESMNIGTWGRAFTWAKKGSGANKGPSTLKDKNGQFTDNTVDTINVLLE